MTSIVPNKMEKPSASGESTMRCMLSSVWYPSTILPSLFVICDSGGRSEVSQVTVAVSPAVHTVSAFGDVIGGVDDNSDELQDELAYNTNQRLRTCPGAWVHGRIS